MTEDTRNALSTFLYRTGDPTNKFMLVFSTNEPESFDRAVTDRVDEAVKLPLPSLSEREQLLTLYFDSYVVRSGPPAAWGRLHRVPPHPAPPPSIPSPYEP